jgi:hypothetical protein
MWITLFSPQSGEHAFDLLAVVADTGLATIRDHKAVSQRGLPVRYAFFYPPME